MIFLDQNFARKYNLRTTKLEQPIRARNMDGTDNKQGTIQYYTDLNIKISDQTFLERFYITGLGNQKVILGLPWLGKHNPEIDWEKGTVTWRNSERSRDLVKQWQQRRESIKKKLLRIFLSLYLPDTCLDNLCHPSPSYLS